MTPHDSQTPVWFITGASRGLGLDIARAALRAGARVVATARSTNGVADDVLAGADGASREDLLVAPLDVTDARQIDAVAGATDRFGRIDVLVNNAGYGQLGMFETVSEGAVRRQFDVNLFGLMELTRRVLPGMRRQGSGHVFNVSSIAGAKGYAGASVYCATKFAVEGFSESLAEEVAPFGIRVTVVEPGFFRTDFLEASSAVYSDAPLPAYAGANAGHKSVFDGISGRQPGDPARLGDALVSLARAEDPPMRYAAGSDAYKIVGDAFGARQAELARWKDLTVSTDHHA